MGKSHGGTTTQKHDPKKLRICVNFQGINKPIVTYPFPTPFAVEIINEVTSHECYSFIDGFSGYNQVPITKKIRKKQFSCRNLDLFPIESCHSD